ncbi:MAG: hypothetical protein J0H94_01995 [Rhizobiales bacterium]|nr:hypothetical protein [Hyphomicrobiales bacterium]
MAADEETPDLQGKSPKRAPQRRPKTPLTIDLEAASASEAASPPVENLADEPDPMGPEPSVPPATPVTPPARAGRDWLALLLAALLGGLAATLIGVAGHSSGLFPSPAQSAADAATAAAKQAADAVTALTARVDGVETAAGKVATIEQSAAALAERVAKLEAAPAAGTPGPDLKPALAELSARIDRLEAAATGATGPGDGQVLADLRGRLAALEASTQALTNRIAVLETRPAAAAPAGESGKAALAIAISALRQAAASGGAFDHDLAMLEVLGLPSSALAELKPLAAKGAPRKSELIEAFPGVADHILASVADAAGGGGFLGQLGAFASSFVSVRPAGPIEGDTPEAIVSRMRDAVEHGDFDKALAERDALPKVAMEASAAWAQAAADRAAIDRLVDKLAATAIPAPAASQ